MKKKKLELFEDTPQCKTCQEYLSERNIYIIDAPCYSCEIEMKVALGRHYSIFGPEEFNIEELKYAKANGVLITNNYSKTAEESYLSNTCPSCNAFIGRFFLFENYFLPAKDYNEYTYVTKLSGYNCQKCDWNNHTYKDE